MGFFSPAEVLDILGDKAQIKKKLSFTRLFLLSIIGGSFIAEGFLACIRVQGTMPAQWGSFATFLGGCLFPIGLMAIVLVGGELATGNMMTMAVGLFQKKISFWDVFYNWAVVMAGYFQAPLQMGLEIILGHWDALRKNYTGYTL